MSDTSDPPADLRFDGPPEGSDEPDALLAPFTPVETLSTGPHFRLLRALDADGRRVVLKIPRERKGPSHRRLRRELRRGRALAERFAADPITAPHAPAILEWREAPGPDLAPRPVLLTEDVGGTSLDRLPAKGLPLDEWLDLAIQASILLGGLHRSGFVHKRFEPSHLLLGSDGRLRLLGLAHVSEVAEERPRSSSSSLTALDSSLAYLSPEQTGRMSRPVDDRSNFYSLGIVLYQLATGRLPFPTADPAELIYCHLAKELPAVRELRPGFPPIFDGILGRLAAKNARDRYQSARGLRWDLETCLEELGRRGKVSSFPLGRRDRPRRFELPRKLYGRQTQVERLHRAYDALVEAGHPDGTRMLWIEGASGTGKSTLPRELSARVGKDRGHLVTGRFDPFRRDIPYSAWVEALSSLCRHLLTEPTDRLEARGRGIRKRVGPGAVGPLTELVPLLGEVVDAAEDGSVDAEDPPPAPGDPPSLATALAGLVGALSDTGPLVIFLDDLQWADSASLDLLEELATGRPPARCLVLGAFQRRAASAGDRSAGDRWEETLERIAETEAKPETLALGNLSRDEVTRLVADAFGVDEGRARPLAELVHTKTDGNPHFVRQTLDSLHEQGFVRPAGEAKNGDDEEPGSFTFDLEAARTLDVADNVVELLTRKIDGLTPEARDVLRLAACLGHTFELSALADVAEIGRGTALRALGACLKAHLVIVVASPYRTADKASSGAELGSEVHGDGEERWFRFSHDRVRQAAYGSLGSEGQERLHLRIARRLHDGDDALDRERLFETLSHYLRGEARVEDPAERRRILELILTAGEKALNGAAYPTAADLLETGARILERTSWNEDPELVFELHRTCLKALGTAERFTAADALYERLRSADLDRADRLALSRVRLEQLIAQGRYEEGIELGRRTLELLGIEMPADEDACERELERDLEELQELLDGRDVEQLANLPPLADAVQGQVLKVLGAVAGCALPTGRSRLPAWAGCRRVCLILRHGLQPGDALAFVAFADSTLIRLRGDYENAYRYGRLAVRVVEGSSSLSSRARTLAMFAGDVQHWKEPLSEGLPLLRKAVGYAVDGGDLLFAGYAVWLLLSFRFQLGEDLRRLERDAEDRVSFMGRSYRTHLEGAFRPALLQAVAHLRGKTEGPGSFDGPSFRERDFLSGEGRIPYFRALYFGARIRGLFLLQRIPEALDLVEERHPIEEALRTRPQLPEYLFFICLTLTAAFDAVTEEDRALYTKILDDYENRFVRWAELCPESCRHRLYLLSAERARIRGDTFEAVRLYRQAVDVAASTGWIHLEALANELFGNFWNAGGEPAAALGYWIRARDLYARWGASAKVEQLESARPEVPASARPAAVGGRVRLAAELDLDHALRASRAISSEIRPRRLLESLMQNVVESAGAQRGCLLLERNGDMRVEVTVALERDGTPDVRVESVALEEYPDLARSVVLFAGRTGEDVVLGDASASARFGADPRLVSLRIPSVLCLPMKRHGRTAGLLYLENRLAAHVFTADRVALLHTLLAQAAISLENAHLYGDLAREVAERKAAEERLREYNRELESKNAELERFTYTVSHDLRSPLVTIKGFLGLLEEDAESGRLDAMREDVARISKATDHMSELLGDLLELSRVGHLVGPPTEIPLLELVQETLELLTIPLADAGIEIRLRPPFPVVLGDRTRLREVLQNLIENSAKFMGDQDRPRIEIGTRPGEDKERVVVFVRDNGVGIAPEHQEVIFGLFQQLNQGMEGTGVGLALVRRIVEVHGGRARIESPGPGQGSTFLFDLPMA